MALLNVVLVFLLARYTAVARCLHRDELVSIALDSLARRWPQRWWAFAVFPVSGVLILAVLWWCSGFWLAFFIALLVLLYSVGRGDWHLGLHDLNVQLQEGNAESVLLRLESWGLIHVDDGTSAQSVWFAWQRYAGLWYLDRLFAVFFWFFLLGPAGALLYRWISLYNQHAAVLSNQLPTAKKLQQALEWLPVRYMGLCACLAGNFTTGFRVWQQHAADAHITSADFLAACLDAALVMDSTPLATAVDESLQLTLERSPALEALMVRTEIIGLVGLALAILLLG